MKNILLLLLVLLITAGCQNKKRAEKAVTRLVPVITTDAVPHDSDDPAIWINTADPGASLILGTDKDADGGLYVFDLSGKMIMEKSITNLQRPNNVDIEYGLMLNGTSVDIAVVTERLTNKLRIFSLPDMMAIDNGGIDVFAGDSLRAPMGIALYKRPADGVIYAITGRKEGPTQGYFWQYRLEDSGQGYVSGVKVREFGAWSGSKEIEAVAVDDELGYVYYSDENVGVRKYFANPDEPEAGKELVLFATEGFTEDREGISIYSSAPGTGYILVSDQQANTFHVFKREGEVNNPHDHKLIKVVAVSTNESDGSDVTNVALNNMFPSGMFVAMSDNRTFQLYSWQHIAEAIGLNNIVQ